MSNSTLTKRTVLRGFILLLDGLAIVPLGPRAAGIGDAAHRDGNAAFEGETLVRANGEALARIVCSACHLFPEPVLLDQRTWREGALPEMAKWLGLVKKNLDLRPGGKFVKAAHLFPDGPLISADVWGSIKRYYLTHAPEQARPQHRKRKIRMGLPGFQVVLPEQRISVPLTTLVKINPKGRGFFLGDGGTRTLSWLNDRGKPLNWIRLSSPPVCLIEKKGRIDLGLIGRVTPSDLPEGAVVELSLGHRAQPVAPLLDRLPRLTDVDAADLNQDGLEDLVVCGFGNYLGRLSWFEAQPEGGFHEHVLLRRPGAVQAIVHDFDRNGLPDLVVLMAQAREGVFLFYNRGGGLFERETLLEFHPLFGSSSLGLVDFNQDGFMDLLITNGDNGEYPSCLKNYHGIRLFLNDGENRFRLQWFFALDGAFHAEARDFDGDKDLDVAAISYFPDYRGQPQESFVYLENLGGNAFQPWSFPEALMGRWLVMDSGDLDGDGDADIVLGSFHRGPNKVPERLMDFWKRQGPSYLILKNLLR